MNILTIPFRNLRRKLPRTLLLGLVFAVGISSVVTLNYLSSVVGESLEKKLTAYGANILVTPKTETLSVGYGGMQLGDVSFDIKYLDQIAAEAAIRSIDLDERISAVAPKFAILTRINDIPVGVIGVNWEQEISIKSYWAVDGTLPDREDQVLAGSAAATVLGLKVGDPVQVEGATFSVAGIIKPTGSEDDQVIFAPITALQQATGNPGRAHFIEVAALCAGCPIEDIVAQIREKLPDVEVTAMQQVVQQRMATIGFVKHLALIVSLIILVTACFMIGLSIFSAVNERKKEIGLMRAIGFSRVSVFAVFCLEAVIVGVLAAIVGYAGGFVASLELLKVLELAEGATLTFAPGHFVATLGAVSLLSLAASAYPAYRASCVEPSQALVML